MSEGLLLLGGYTEPKPATHETQEIADKVSYNKYYVVVLLNLVST